MILLVTLEQPDVIEHFEWLLGEGICRQRQKTWLSCRRPRGWLLGAKNTWAPKHTEMKPENRKGSLKMILIGCRSRVLRLTGDRTNCPDCLRLRLSVYFTSSSIIKSIDQMNPTFDILSTQWWSNFHFAYSYLQLLSDTIHLRKNHLGESHGGNSEENKHN